VLLLSGTRERRFRSGSKPRRRRHGNRFEDIRKTFPSADMVGCLVVFNVKGNRYRLIVRMEFRSRRIYIKEFLTHAEHDKGHGENGL